MHVLGVLLLIIGAAGDPLTADSSGSRAAPVRMDTVVHTAVDSVPDSLVVDAASGTVEHPSLRIVLAPADTPRTRRPHAIEVSDWYSRRLTIHRYVAYATIPVFAVQWAAGDQLFKKGNAAPTWAKTMHRVGATALAGMFTVNTVTGAWNWWDSRSSSQGRVLRTVHALSMLAADAAFTYTGAKLSNDAETSSHSRQLHKTIALEAMGVTALSALAMKLFNH
jgi:hypothetical protein